MIPSIKKFISCDQRGIHQYGGDNVWKKIEFDNTKQLTDFINSGSNCFYVELSCPITGDISKIYYRISKKKIKHSTMIVKTEIISLREINLNNIFK